MEKFSSTYFPEPWTELLVLVLDGSVHGLAPKEPWTKPNNTQKKKIHKLNRTKKNPNQIDYYR